MSKLSLVLLLVFVAALATAQNVLREKNNNDGSGVFEFTYGFFQQNFLCLIYQVNFKVLFLLKYFEKKLKD